VGRAAGRAGGRALVEVTQRAAVRRAMASRDALARRAPVPELLGATRRRGLVALEWLEGEALEDSLESTPRAAEAVGLVLAAVHELDGLGLALRPDFDAQRLTAAARATLVVSPALAQRADRLATALVGELRPAGPRTAVHGDFSADQVVLGARGAMLVDLDETRRDYPAVDPRASRPSCACAWCAGDCRPRRPSRPGRRSWRATAPPAAAR
jgi:aminoglycoside phosphotransferase (APT) family kinase protein